MSKKRKEANRLVSSTSPYLLQHAYNPVDWFTWNDEALEIAKKEDKPILVSIGYSACHWCHVMEHESFEDEQTASLMNKHFVCIKVDREERPDIDNIYMESVQAMGLQGGWPLNVFLTPEQKPFYGGTYFPKAGWQQLLQSVAKAFKENRKKLEESADKFTEALVLDEVSKYKLGDYTPGFDKELIDEAAKKLYRKLDSKHGGISKAPKFPMPSIWFFLLRHFYVTKDNDYLKAVVVTLDKMASGGIYDHLEGGFSRYSVDEKWFAPHFEKMLYDNGQLLALYSEAYSLTKNESYKRVIERTIEWMTVNMLSPGGGFYSALDADSEGLEGKYYVWESKEIDQILGDDAEVFKTFFNVREGGNWENGKNILFTTGDLDQFLKSQKLSKSHWEKVFEKCRTKLLEERRERVAPGLDNKILAGWNGLALTGIIKAYLATGNVEYLSLAQATAGFLKDKMIAKDGKVLRVINTKIQGVLEDYAFVIDAFIQLYQADFNSEWIQLAEKLTRYAISNFYDKRNGMFFITDSNATNLIARKKEIFDNVIPSSNSQMAENIRRLGILLDNKEWTDLSKKMVLQVKKFIENDVEYMSNWASTFIAMTQPAAEIAIIGSDLISFNQKISSHFYPFKLITGTEKKDDSLPILKNREPQDGKTTIYVCFNKACKLPVQSVDDAIKQLPGFEPAGT